jgi:helicase
MPLLPPQAEVLDAGLLDTGFNCILQMPTGSGKTWLAEQAIARVLDRGQRAIYLAPLRALANELATAWQSRFKAPVGVFTGDFGAAHKPYPIPFEQARLLVMTPERLDICTRFWRRHWDWLPEVDLVVVDEFHLLGEGLRGARLEGALSRFQRLNPFTRLLCLSATLGNREELADWLQAVEYTSDWRPIPLCWRIVRYRQAEDKPRLLQDEVWRCTQAGGQSLVFVQSRRRAEQLSRVLQNAGLRVAHHHAGLDRARRRTVEDGFRQHAYDALVATATLEMGLNLPVRQVVLYDLQHFDGTGFVPLSTNAVWQRVGRAGRPGLDPEGEAVLLAPSWDGQVKCYEAGRFEPIRSGLPDERALAEQVIVEVSGGFGRTATQLERIFSGSLAAWQSSLNPAAIRRVINTLQEAGLLQARSEAAPEGSLPRLQVTPVGKIAVRHLLYPATVLRFQSVSQMTGLTFLDLLLLVASTSDCEPVLPVNFEELEVLSERLRTEPSQILALTSDVIVAKLGVMGKRLLATLKMALAVRALTRSGDTDRVADCFNCYPFELERLADSMERLLLAWSTQLQVQGEPANPAGEPVWQVDTITLAERVEILQHMVAARLDERAVTLTQVKGIGPTLARRLVAHDIKTLAELAQADPETVAKIPGISRQRAETLIEDAIVLLSLRPTESYGEVTGSPSAAVVWPAGVDPYRLRRSLELKVRLLEPGGFQVTGGTDPHRVQLIEGSYRCDCADFQNGRSQCKHVLAIRLHQGDQVLQRQAAVLKARPSPVTGLDLWSLWTGTEQPSTVGWR